MLDCYVELIDTCWDVNVNGAIATWHYLGINRYMLGCKLKKLVANVCLHKELIDTCWDVNSEKVYSPLSFSVN